MHILPDEKGLLVEGCAVLFVDICFIVLFLKIAQLREGPGQLILAQTQAQILVDLHWLFGLSFTVMTIAYICRL